MNKPFLVFAFLTLTLCSLGASATNPSSSASTNSLAPDACEAITKATPEANVAYQAGVDVHGNAVAPADLPNAPQMVLPKTFTIPLTIGLANVLKLNTTSYPYNQLGTSTEAVIGVLTVSGDHVLFNGQPISDEQQNNLSVLCMKQNQK